MEFIVGKLSCMTKKETKIVTTNFNQKDTICKTQNFDILLVFLLITTELLIADSIYCYLKKRLSKTKPFITISSHK